MGGYGGLGRHALLTCLRMFPGHFQGVVFVSVAVVDTGAFKGEDEVEALVERTKESLAAYVRFANSLGLAGDERLRRRDRGPGRGREARRSTLSKDYPRGLVVAGQLVFDDDTLWNHVLHNETAFLIQRRLQRVGVPMIVVPVRLNLEAAKRDYPIVPRTRTCRGVSRIRARNAQLTEAAATERNRRRTSGLNLEREARGRSSVSTCVLQRGRATDHAGGRSRPSRITRDEYSNSIDAPSHRASPAAPSPCRPRTSGDRVGRRPERP